MKVFILVCYLAAASSGLAQLGPCAVPIGPNLPDLIVDREGLKSRIYASEERFSSGSCTVLEGCVTSAGRHLVLRFMSSTPNIGQADLYVGDPDNCSNLFRNSECHQHQHFEEYADYRLWTTAGYLDWAAKRNMSQPTNSGVNLKLLDAARASGALIVGRKQGFCLIDIAPYPYPGIDPGEAVYRSCSTNQGIKVGWADQYVPELACQFIQIDNLPEGYYVLEDHVNAEQLLPESDYTNNSSAVTFYFKPKKGRFGATITVVD